MTFCELTNFKYFEGFCKSRVGKMFFFHNRGGGGSTHYGKFHKKNAFLLKPSITNSKQTEKHPTPITNQE